MRPKLLHCAEKECRLVPPSLKQEGTAIFVGIWLVQEAGVPEKKSSQKGGSWSCGVGACNRKTELDNMNGEGEEAPDYLLKGRLRMKGSFTITHIS